MLYNFAEGKATLIPNIGIKYEWSASRSGSFNLSTHCCVRFTTDLDVVTKINFPVPVGNQTPVS
jgi:hypothetical protein